MDKNKYQDKIQEIYKKYAPMVFRRCKYILKDEDLAYDATQDVFEKFMKRMVLASIVNLSSYLYRMATNTCLNMIKKKDYLAKPLDLFDFFDPQEGLEDRVIAKDLIDRIFKDVDPKTKRIAYLRYKNKLPHKEIAEIVKLSESGVRMKLYALKKRAKLILEA